MVKIKMYPKFSQDCKHRGVMTLNFFMSITWAKIYAGFWLRIGFSLERILFLFVCFFLSRIIRVYSYSSLSTSTITLKCCEDSASQHKLNRQFFAKIPVHCAFMKANMNAIDPSRKACRLDTLSAKARALISDPSSWTVKALPFLRE